MGPHLAGTHPTADIAPASADADCSKGSPPSGSPAKSANPPAIAETETSRSNPPVLDSVHLRQIPIGRESSSHILPEFPAPIFRQLTSPDQVCTAQYRTPKAAPQPSASAP